MDETHNPLVPQAYDIAWLVVAVAVFVLLVAALISIGRHASQRHPVLTLAWMLIAVFVPVIGPIAWFAAGSRADARPADPRRGVGSTDV